VLSPTIDRQSRLSDALRELELRFGPDIVYRLSQARPKLGERSVSSGSIGIDHITGIGGFPRGRPATIDGPESSGKTTLAYHIIASAQRDSGMAALIDVEQAVDPALLVSVGCSLDDLVLGIPTDPLEALEQADILARSATLDAIVVLGLGGYVRHSVVSDASRRISLSLAGTPTALVYVGFGQRIPPTTLHASLSLGLRPVGLLARNGGEVIGMTALAEITASRLGPPGGNTTIDIIDGRGISRPAELIRLGVQSGVIAQTSQGLVFADVLLGRGRAAALERLGLDSTLACSLEDAVRASLEAPIPPRLK
jgi:recombination protein RecA